MPLPIVFFLGLMPLAMLILLMLLCGVALGEIVRAARRRRG